MFGIFSKNNDSAVLELGLTDRKELWKMLSGTGKIKRGLTHNGKLTVCWIEMSRFVYIKMNGF